MNGERETVRDEAGGGGGGSGGGESAAHVEQTSNKVDEITIDTVDQGCLKAENLPDALIMASTDNSAGTRPESRVVGNENGLKIKISTALGKSWVNSSHLNKQNGDGQMRNGDDVERDSQIATTSKASPAAEVIIASDVNGLLAQSNSVLSIKSDDDDDLSQMPPDLVEEKLSNSAGATNDVKLKLNCTSRGGKLLSHWEIMNKCLNKKMLFETLKVGGTSPSLYECPICHYTKSIPQHVLLHMRSHKDLTSVFEFYQSHEQLPPDDKQDAEALDVAKSEPVSFKRRKQKLLEENRSSDHPKESNSRPSTLSMATSGDSDNSIMMDSDLNEEQSHSDYGAVSKRKQQRRRRRRSQMEEPNSPASVVVSEYLTSDDSNQLDLVPIKSVTDIDDRDSDDIDFSPRRLRKRKPSGQLPIFGNDFITDPYDSNQSMEGEIFDGMHYEFLDESVSTENPHFCQYCGTKLTRGSAIARHYAKHHRKRTSQSRKKRRRKKKKIVVEEVPKNGTASATCQTTISYNINSSLLSVEQEKKIAQILQQLETNVNKVLEYFVKDVEVLISIGWPHRNVSDLLVDILDRCNIAPVCRGSSKLSMLKCVRQNVSELLSFCIKDEVMESNGWKSQLVDDVIRELIEKVEERGSSDQEL